MATTGNDNQHDRVKSYCGPFAPAGWTRAEFESVIQTATDEWERAPDYQGGGPSLTLTKVNWNLVEGCVADVEIVFKTDSEMGGAVGKWVPDSDPGGNTGEIWLNDNVDWRKPAQSTTGQQLSLLGVLVHEMGHSIGIWHSGDEDWTFDGSDYPTMNNGTSAAESQNEETIQQDDLGSVQWIDFKDRTIGRFFSDDPSFEGTFPGNWGRYDSSNVTQTSATAKAGSKSVLLKADGAGVFITSVFDPWKENTLPRLEMPGMDPAGNGKHKLQAYASWKETASGGDIEVGYTFAWLACDPIGEKDGTWSGNFPSYETKICANTGAGWENCNKSKSVDLDGFPTVQGTIIFRIRVLASDADVYIDRVGARRRAP